MEFDQAKDIVYGLKPDYDMHDFPIERVPCKSSPNHWQKIKDDPSKKGKDFDYRILDGDVFMPTCEAAQEWVRAKFPEGCQYYTDIDGWTGVRVTYGMEYVTRRAHLDGLISEEFYEAAMENDELMRSGE